jgi:integrase
MVPMQIESSSRTTLTKTGTPGVYKRGNRYVVVFRDPQGRQRKRSARTLAEARDLRSSLVADVKRGEYRALSRVTFAEYAPQWLATYQGRTSRGVRETTLDEYRREVGLDRDGNPTGTGAIRFFGRLRLAEIEPRHVKEYAAEVARRGVSTAAVRHALAPVKALLATALEEGLVRSNPAAGIRVSRPALEEADEDKVKALTPAELRALIDETEPDWRLFVELLARTGLRIGEAVALRWQDVDFARRRVKVRRRSYRGSFAPPKSRHGRRDVPLSKPLARSLAALWERQGRPDGERLVFPSERGTPLDPGKLAARVLRPAAQRAGVPWATWHTLRHTCATLLFQAGLNAKQVQVWLGHHSPSFTLDTYVHLLDADLPSGDILDNVLDRPGGNNGATRAPEKPRNRRVAGKGKSLQNPEIPKGAEAA